MAFSRQEYWSVLPCPPPEDLPNPASLTAPTLAASFSTNTTWETPQYKKNFLSLNKREILGNFDSQRSGSSMQGPLQRLPECCLLTICSCPPCAAQVLPLSKDGGEADKEAGCASGNVSTEGRSPQTGPALMNFSPVSQKQIQNSTSGIQRERVLSK